MEDNVEEKVAEKPEGIKEAKLISQLLEKEMRENRLSTRDVAKKTGVAHTTIMRVLQGKVVSVKTLQVIAKFLRTDPGGFVILKDTPTLDTLANDIATIIGYNDVLHEKISEAAAKVRTGEISADVITECIRFIAWRISEQEVELDEEAAEEPAESEPAEEQN